jgi:choline dehydrogenase-like flavoprotein
MAPATNPMAVVDHELRVHRLSGLRVADASIMPTVVSANTNAACIIIGEKYATSCWRRGERDATGGDINLVHRSRTIASTPTTVGCRTRQIAAGHR